VPEPTAPNGVQLPEPELAPAFPVELLASAIDLLLHLDLGLPREAVEKDITARGLHLAGRSERAPATGHALFLGPFPWAFDLTYAADSVASIDVMLEVRQRGGTDAAAWRQACAALTRRYTERVADASGVVGKPVFDGAHGQPGWPGELPSDRAAVWTLPAGGRLVMHLFSHEDASPIWISLQLQPPADPVAAP
jgi:hypothetical protein